MKSRNKTYLAVDYDGTEKISNSPFVRRQELDGRRIVGALWGMVTGMPYSKNDRKKWSNSWSTDEKDFLPFEV